MVTLPTPGQLRIAKDSKGNASFKCFTPKQFTKESVFSFLPQFKTMPKIQPLLQFLTTVQNYAKKSSLGSGSIDSQLREAHSQCLNKNLFLKRSTILRMQLSLRHCFVLERLEKEVAPRV
ncbi:hypothetical protein H5410_025409, partial [Solanum commersonii]